MCCDVDLLLGTSPLDHTLHKTSLYLFPPSSVTLVSRAGGERGGAETGGAAGEIVGAAGEAGEAAGEAAGAAVKAVGEAEKQQEK